MSMNMGAFSDGAPSRAKAATFQEEGMLNLGETSKLPPLPGHEPDRLSAPKRATKAVSRIQQFEGGRGYSARTSVYLRYFAYFAAIILCSSLTEVFTKGIPNASGGGRWMFFSMATIVVSGAISSLFFTNLRNEIAEKIRHYIFGYAMIPGTLVALFLFVAQNYLGMDAFGGTLAMALPVVFLCTVIIPALVFLKEISGLRTIHRSKLDDQEAVALWTRNDGLQR